MSEYIWGDHETQFFFSLGPEVVLDAVDKLGLKTTGRCLTLNSMENRVYEIEVESNESTRFVVAKFYRPGRWSKEQILEEHQFLMDLQEYEVPVVAPFEFDGETLFELEGHKLWYTLFPKKGGRLPQEFNQEQLAIMGRMLARMHNVGAMREAKHRIKITPDSFGLQNLKFLMSGQFLPSYLVDSYRSLVEQICQLSKPLFESVKFQRIHGDCHLGNIIWRDSDGPFFIDFDDMLVGPAIQDIWLVVPGVDEFALSDRSDLICAYEEMRAFNWGELKLIEPLRALRYVHFSAWIAKRWEDPAFQSAFSHFGSDAYWEIQVNDLKQQLQLIQASLNEQNY